MLFGFFHVLAYLCSIICFVPKYCANKDIIIIAKMVFALQFVVFHFELSANILNWDESCTDESALALKINGAVWVCGQSLARRTFVKTKKYYRNETRLWTQTLTIKNARVRPA